MTNCKICGNNIKFENGKWHHYKKQTHWAVPPETPSIKNKLLNTLRNIYFRYIIMFVLGFLTSSFSGITKEEIKELLSNTAYFVLILVFLILVVVVIIKTPRQPPNRPQRISMVVQQ